MRLLLILAANLSLTAQPLAPAPSNPRPIRHRDGLRLLPSHGTRVSNRVESRSAGACGWSVNEEMPPGWIPIKRSLGGQPRKTGRFGRTNLRGRRGLRTELRGQVSGAVRLGHRHQQWPHRLRRLRYYRLLAPEKCNVKLALCRRLLLAGHGGDLIPLDDEPPPAETEELDSALSGPIVSL